MYLPTSAKKSLVNLTPLIDMVFILLIFFMLASNFVEWQYFELEIGEMEELVIDHDKVSIIRIAEDHTYFLNNKRLPLNNIVIEIRKRVRTDVEHPIVVQLAQNAKLQSMIDVLDSLQKFASANVSVAKPENTSKNNEN